ncbi:MAG TPA: hypothetical protein VF408_02655 [Sediminibacterium sp.]|jgi:hypothetical protein
MWERWPARALPKVDIGGTQFFLDLRLWEMREVTDFMNRISINDLQETMQGFRICFDTRTKNLFQGSQEAYGQQKDFLLIIELPTLADMDPVGWKAYVETWKDENPALAATIQGIPTVLPDALKSQKHDLLAPKRNKEPLLAKKRTRKSPKKRL